MAHSNQNPTKQDGKKNIKGKSLLHETGRKMVIKVVLKFPHRNVCIYSISKACIKCNV